MLQKRRRNTQYTIRNTKRGVQEEIISAGFGGQGIMLLGKLLSISAMKENKHVTWMPSYGAEVRGGTAHSMVKISTRKIASPVVDKPTTCIVMNRPSFIKFKDRVKKGGLFLINSSLVKDEFKRKDIRALRIPATDIATELGNVKVANMVMLGACLKTKAVVSLNTAISSLRDIFASKDKEIISLNELALRKGWEEVHGRN